MNISQYWHFMLVVHVPYYTGSVFFPCTVPYPVNSNLPLQVSLYFNVYYSPLWLTGQIISLVNKVVVIHVCVYVCACVCTYVCVCMCVCMQNLT